jgi:hypothetical protein
MEEAIDRQITSNDVSGHGAWIIELQQKYYDPMYEYQLQSKKQRIVFHGDYQQVLVWATAQINSGSYPPVISDIGYVALRIIWVSFAFILVKVELVLPLKFQISVYAHVQVLRFYVKICS